MADMRTTVVDVLGVESLSRKLKKLSENAKKELAKAVVKVAFKIEGDAKKLISQGSRSGATYKRRTVTHQASAPGEPPKTDRGGLVRNITTEFSKSDRLEATVGSRSNAPYGKYLELGTLRIKPRPWLKPTVDKNKKFSKETFEAAVKKSTEVN